MDEILVIHPDREQVDDVLLPLKTAGFHIVYAAIDPSQDDAPLLLPPDVVLLIDDSPKGCQVCSWVRASTDMPIMAFCDDPDGMVRMMELGADVCLTLPISSKELIARLRSLLRRYRLTYAANAVVDSREIESRQN